MINLLYICDYNIDRSPTAAIITRQIAGRMGIEDLVVDSAGFHGVRGHSGGIRDEMEVALRNRGYDPENHTPKKVTKELLDQQNTILCFTSKQVDTLLEREPHLGGIGVFVETLTGYVGKKEDIRTPIENIKGWPSGNPNGGFVDDLVYGFFSRLYRGAGFAYNRDRDAVIRVNERLIEKIERYIESAIQKMIEEGLIHSSSPN